MTAPPQGPPQHSTPGIVSLVMGIVGLAALPLIGPIIALIFGYQSRNLAAEQPAAYSDDLGRVGRILGWIGIAFSAVGLLIGVLVIVFFVGLAAI